MRFWAFSVIMIVILIVISGEVRSGASTQSSKDTVITNPTAQMVLPHSGLVATFPENDLLKYIRPIKAKDAAIPISAGKKTTTLRGARRGHTRDRDPMAC